MSTTLYVNDPWSSPITLSRALQLSRDKTKYQLTPSLRRSYTVPQHNNKNTSPKSRPSSPRLIDSTPRTLPTAHLRYSPHYQRPLTPPWYRVPSTKRPATADDNKTSLALERQRDAMVQVSSAANVK